MEYIGIYSVVIIITITAVAILFSKKDLFSELLKGTRDGFITSIKILPSLILLICAVRMFTASGAITILCNVLGGFLRHFNFPVELVPLILIRPISGSAATAMADSLFTEVGPDSFAGRCASVLMGASDTIIYTLSMYFSAVNIKRTRHALLTSFLVLVFCIYISVTLTKLIWY